MTALIALLVLSQSPYADAEVFVDRGETYIRAGTINGLQVGTGLDVFDAKTRTIVGSAVVMEVWDALSRISIDSKAQGHTPLKVVRVPKAPEAVPPPAAVAEPYYPPPVPLPPPVLTPVPVPPNTLVGHATTNGARVVIYNTSNRDWHDCDVRLSNNRHYRIGDLDRDHDEGIMLFRFEYDGAPAWPSFNGVTVICREGIGRFLITL